MFSENEGYSSSDTFFASDIHCKQQGMVSDRFDLDAAAGSAVYVRAGELLRRGLSSGRNRCAQPLSAGQELRSMLGIL